MELPALTSLESIFLEPEQKALLLALVDAHRSIPREQRQDFVFHIALIRKGAHSRAKMEGILDKGSSIWLDGKTITKKDDIPKDLDQDFVTHPGLESGNVDTHLNDIDALRLQHLISFRSETKFFVTPQGFAYCERIKPVEPQITQGSPMTIEQSTEKIPTAFISYSWDNEEHKQWVRDLATKLRSDGVAVTLDRWHAVPGDQLPAFMEESVRNSDYVLIVCTPAFKKKSDKRTGGVGYEGDIITAEVFTTRNHRKFIPLLRDGNWREAAPAWVKGAYYIDLTGDPYSEEHYKDLKVTLLGQREQAPPIGSTASKAEIPEPKPASVAVSPENPMDSHKPIKILGVVVDEITTPRNDGSRGSALYAIPFQLSRRPSSDWAQIFVETWNNPPRFTTMHRPGIASVQGNKIVLNGTTIDEVEQHHRDTLKLVIERTNELALEREGQKQRRQEQERQKQQTHAEAIKEAAKRLTWD